MTRYPMEIGTSGILRSILLTNLCLNNIFVLCVPPLLIDKANFERLAMDAYADTIISEPGHLYLYLNKRMRITCICVGFLLKKYSKFPYRTRTRSATQRGLYRVYRWSKGRLVSAWHSRIGLVWPALGKWVARVGQRGGWLGHGPGWYDYWAAYRSPSPLPKDE